MQIKHLIQYFTDKEYRFYVNDAHELYNSLDDESYLKKKYMIRFGKKLDLENPQTYNEKLQWLKILVRNPSYCKMVDKNESNKAVAEIIGEEYIFPTLGVWERFDEIDFDSLPDQFVLKCSHDSGGIAICKDKNSFNKLQAKKKLEKSLSQNYYWHGREWPYKSIKPRILAEKYMEDESGYELKDYKIFCFHGEPKMIQVDYDRFIGHKRNLYTVDWQYIEASIQYPTDPNRIIQRPQALDEMLSLAKRLSKGFVHVRTDFYCINEKVYFGEMTFFHESGFAKFQPESFGLTMGNWLDLSELMQQQGTPE